MEEREVQSVSKFYLNEESTRFLKETAKWAYFLSILGFVGVGVMVLLTIYIGTIFSKLGMLGDQAAVFQSIGGSFISGIYLFVAVLYFFPIYYLFKFSTKLKIAFKTANNELLNESFIFLKSHYKFMGILALVFVVIYGLIFLFTLLAGAIAIFS